MKIIDDSRYLSVASEGKFYAAFERALVNEVNKVGIDFNRAVNEPYHVLMLPFVSDLGPRKAQALVKRNVAIVSQYVVQHISWF